jgi:hypothetical protein
VLEEADGAALELAMNCEAPAGGAGCVLAGADCDLVVFVEGCWAVPDCDA